MQIRFSSQPTSGNDWRIRGWCRFPSTASSSWTHSGWLDEFSRLVVALRWLSGRPFLVSVHLSPVVTRNYTLTRVAVSHKIKRQSQINVLNGDWKRGTGKHGTSIQGGMQGRSYKCSKTEMDVIVHCWKHTGASCIHSAVINQCIRNTFYCYITI